LECSGFPALSLFPWPGIYSWLGRTGETRNMQPTAMELNCFNVPDGMANRGWPPR
jgi:hypothetical protein